MSTNRSMELANDARGVRLVPLSGVLGEGVAGMSHEVGHIHL